MSANDVDITAHEPIAPNKQRSRLGYLVGAVVTVASVWFIVNNVAWDELVTALRTANYGPIVLGVGIIVLTGLAKAWRWQQLFVPASTRPSFGASYEALMVNQLVNIVIFGRFGELARAYNISKHKAIDMAHALGTIVVEKGIETLFTVILIGALLPLGALPPEISSSAPLLAISAIVSLLVLWAMAFRSGWVISISERITGLMPRAIGGRLNNIVTSGLDGLHALRDRNALLRQMAISSLIVLCYVLAPYITFKAFGLPFSFANAALLHLWVSLVTAPPSTPGKIGVHEGATMAFLWLLNPSESAEAIHLSYAIVYHLITLVPPLIIGAIAAARSDWGWRTQ